MNRRDTLWRLAGLTATAAVAGLPAVVAGAREATRPDAAFARSFTDVPAFYPPRTVRFDRPLPAGLAGTLYRNGPARMQLGPTRYRHWFDGDGMVQSFRLHGQDLVHQGRLVQTRRLIAENAAGRYLWPGFGTTFPDARQLANADDMNVANISVLPLRDELLALWEGGSAWRLDPDSLATRGRKIFSEETDGMPFSAHPRADPSGRIWSFGYLSGSGRLALYELDPSGRLLRARVIEAPNADMVHDFAVTERYLVFLLMPLHLREGYEASAHSFMDRLQWDDDGAVEIVVVDKASLTVAHRLQTSSFFAFHFGNAWEDGQSLRVDVARAPGFRALMDTITRATVGQPGPELPGERALQLVIDLNRGKVRTLELPVQGAEFPRFDQRFTGTRTGRLFMLANAPAATPAGFGFNRVVVIDSQRERLATWTYPGDVLAEEHLFVPAPGSVEGRGWLLGTVFDPSSFTTSLHVLDAEDVAAGPLATARLPYHLPLGLHGQFVAA